MNVVHLHKRLSENLPIRPLQEVAIRHFVWPDDFDDWRQLRSRAFANMRPSVRPWSKEDFEKEMLTKWWWHPQCTWIAETSGPRSTMIGAATLALRGPQQAPLAIVHWLMVDPGWQRRGIGQLLLDQLEQMAWQAGYREVHLETHSRWEVALRLYEKAGYRRQLD